MNINTKTITAVLSSMLSINVYADSGTCGSEEWQKVIIPDSHFGARFAPYCAKHDECYDTCGMKKDHCDNDFKSGLRQECKDTYVKPEHVFHRKSCLEAANLYHSAVHRLGGDAYRDAQNNCHRPYGEIAKHNHNCTSGHVSQSKECTEAIGKFCKEKFPTLALVPETLPGIRLTGPAANTPVPKEQVTAGIAQEVSEKTFVVACMRPESHSSVLAEGLTKHHSGCRSLSKSRSPECTAAAHRYCVSHGHDAGYVQDTYEWFENPNDVVGSRTYFPYFRIVCFDTDNTIGVNIAELKQHHQDCSSDKPQSHFCYSAAHRYCKRNFNANVGLIQESEGDNFIISCVEDVNWLGAVGL